MLKRLGDDLGKPLLTLSPEENEASDIGFMRMALQEAELALARGDGPIGCVIVRSSDVIARAGNRVYSTGCKLDHAEMVAIRACSDDLWDAAQDCTLYTTLEPCAMCIGAIASVRIGAVVYGEPDPDHGGRDASQHIPYVQERLNDYRGGVLARECAELRATWSRPASPR